MTPPNMTPRPVNPEVIRAYDHVWQMRQTLAPHWPTPDPLDSAFFAFTEAGEVVDAWMRGKSEYVRNTNRTRDMEEELADCAMMLLTSLGPDCQWAKLGDRWPVLGMGKIYSPRRGGQRHWPELAELDSHALIAWLDLVMGALVNRAGVPVMAAQRDAIKATHVVNKWLGGNLQAAIAARMDRIANKVLP